MHFGDHLDKPFRKRTIMKEYKLFTREINMWLFLIQNSAVINFS